MRNDTVPRNRRVLTDVRVAFVVALLLHVGVVVLRGHYRRPSGLESMGIAGHLYEGKGFSAWAKSEEAHFPAEAREKARERVRQGGPPPYSEMHPTSQISPGYPYFLYFTWKLFGRNAWSFLLIGLLQVLMVSSVVLPVRWVTDRWFGSRAGVWAMWIACFMPLYAHYAAQYSPMAFYITFHPWLVFAWFRLKDRPGVVRAAVVGAATGLAALFQPLLLGVFGALGVAFLIDFTRHGRWRETAALLVVPCALVVVLAPWSVRNYAVHGRIMLIRQSAMPLWVGNNPLAAGVETVAGGKVLYNDYPPKCVLLGTEVSEREYYAALRKEAWDYVRAEPMAFIRRTSKKILWYWTFVPLKHGHGDGPSSNPVYRALHATYWLAFLVVAVTARCSGGRFSPDYALIMILYFMVCSGAYGLTHIGNARMRAEIEFILIPAVAHGIVLAGNRFCGGKAVG